MGRAASPSKIAAVTAFAKRICPRRMNLYCTLLYSPYDGAVMRYSSRARAGDGRSSFSGVGGEEQPKREGAAGDHDSVLAGVGGAVRDHRGGRAHLRYQAERGGARG